MSVLNLEYLSNKETRKGLLMGRAKKDPKGDLSNRTETIWRGKGLTMGREF